MSDAEATIRAWLRLDAAFAAANADLKQRHGVTGAQLGMVRLLDEFGGEVRLSELRARLAIHPATLGQLFARLEAGRLVVTEADPSDRRRRVVRLTDSGRELLAAAPLVGPVRLRHRPPGASTRARLTEAFTEAIDAFGLTDYAQQEWRQ